MRTKVTLVLVFLNVALFFFIFKFERAWRTDDQLREVRRRVLGDEASNISFLEVTGTSPASSYTLTRRGEVWWLTKPVEWPANPHAVHSIVQELQLLDHVSSFSTDDLEKNGQKLSDYGLEHPKLTVAFYSGEPGAGTPAVATLAIGDATTSGDRLYVLSPDRKRIHVVGRALVDTLSVTPAQLRTDTLFSIPVFEARALSVRTGSPDQARGGILAGVPVHISRDGARWTFDTPFSGRGSRSDIEIAISRLDALQAKTFDPPNPPAARPAAAPAMRITVEGNNRSETLLLGDALGTTAIPTGTATAPDVEYYAQLDGRNALFTVVIPAELMRTLRNASVSLRERQILDFNPRAVTAINIAAPLQPGQPSLTLQRLDQSGDNGDWQLVRRGDAAQGAQTLPADRATVQGLLDQLRLLSATTFENDAPADADLETWGFKSPEREVTLTLSDSATAGSGPARNTTLVLQLGTNAGHRVFARVNPVQNPKGSVYGVDFDFERELPVLPRAWRERLLREFRDPARITALALTPLGEGAAPIYTHALAAGESWSALFAAEPEPKKSALPLLLDHVRVLRARSFLQDNFTDKILVGGEERPWKYRLDVTASLPGGAGGEQTSTLTLLLSDRVGGAKMYAGSKELDVVFELEQPLLDALWKLIYPDPGPPPVSAEPKK